LEERLQVAVFIDFDNIEIGVKTTLNTELDLSLVLEALKERGEVVSKSAYGDWARAGMHSRTLTEHAVHMVQRNVTPRGDKNGADINLVVDALEMAFTRPHISVFAIVGGDSDFIALVEKLKQFGKRVLVVGGRSFTSGVLQRNCHEFISYENLLSASRSGRGSPSQSRGGQSGRLPMSQGLEKVQRALKILADRGVEPQLGPLKSTLLQLDSTFSERDYGASSFREFIQRLDDHGFLHLRRIDQGYLVETNGDGARPSGRSRHARSAPQPAAEAPPPPEPAASAEDGEPAAADGNGSAEAIPSAGSTASVAPAASPAAPAPAGTRRPEDAIGLLRAVVDKVSESRAGKPMYVRHLAQGLRAADPTFDETTYGFRTLTELVHLGQREGILRMQRDRQGAWRITSASPAAGGGAPSSTAMEPDVASAQEGDRGAAQDVGPDGGERFAEATAASADPAAIVAEGANGGEPAASDGDGASAEGDEAAGGRRTSRRRKAAVTAATARKPRTPKAAKPAARAPRSRGGGGSRKKTTVES